MIRFNWGRVESQFYRVKKTGKKNFSKGFIRVQFIFKCDRQWGIAEGFTLPFIFSSFQFVGSIKRYSDDRSPPSTSFLTIGIFSSSHALALGLLSTHSPVG